MAMDSCILYSIHSHSFLQSSNVAQIRLEMRVLVVGGDDKNQCEEVNRRMEGYDDKSAVFQLCEVCGEGTGA